MMIGFLISLAPAAHAQTMLREDLVTRVLQKTRDLNVTLPVLAHRSLNAAEQRIISMCAQYPNGRIVAPTRPATKTLTALLDRRGRHAEDSRELLNGMRLGLRTHTDPVSQLTENECWIEIQRTCEYQQPLPALAQTRRNRRQRRSLATAQGAHNNANAKVTDLQGPRDIDGTQHAAPGHRAPASAREFSGIMAQ